MTGEKGRRANLPASVHDRLLQWAKQHGEEYQFVLTRYCLERFLYRLSRSPHNMGFVLKGAMLFALWTGHAHRPTRDLDLLGRGDNSVEGLEGVLRDICNQPVEDDGVVFLADTVRGERVREEAEYQGVRVRFDVRQTAASPKRVPKTRSRTVRGVEPKKKPKKEGHSLGSRRSPPRVT